MAVPKKKNSKIKYKYSIRIKEYLLKMGSGINICKYCNNNIHINDLKFFWKKKICLNCLKILKKKKISKNEK